MSAALQFNRLFVNELESWPDRMVVSGYVEIGHDKCECNFALNYCDFSNLLARNQAVATRIIRLIEEAFCAPHHVPIRLNLLEHFGATQPFFEPGGTGNCTGHPTVN